MECPNSKHCDIVDHTRPGHDKEVSTSGRLDTSMVILEDGTNHTVLVTGKTEVGHHIRVDIAKMDQRNHALTEAHIF